MNKTKTEDSFIRARREEKRAVRREVATVMTTTLLKTKQWGHEAIVRNAIQLTDMLLESLEGPDGPTH